MGLSINILSDEFVKPSSPTKDDLKKYNISLLDELNPNIPVPLILYYHHQHQQTTDFHFSCRLKESLSDTLTMFYPLAGRLKTGESSVHCNDMGVRYLEVKVDSNISDVIEDNHEAKLHDQFIPTLMMPGSGTSIKEDENDLLLAIQINYFNCGGIAIGARFAHRIVDACTLISFMRTWATLVRKGNVKPPSLISSTIFPPSNEKLLVEIPPSNNEEERQLVVVRRFVFDAPMISYLRAKARIDRPNMVEPSRVGVVSAFIWKCSITTRGRGGGEKIYMLAQGVDIRSRMVPPVTEHVFGNFVTPAFAISSEESDLGSMAEKIREGIEKIDHKYVRWFGLEGGYKAILGMGEKKKQGEGEQVGSNSKKAEIFKLSSWCRFPVYEVDFGMGKPVWVGFVSNNLKNSAILMDSKFGKGIEAWVTMTEEDFTKFQFAFKELARNLIPCKLLN